MIHDTPMERDNKALVEKKWCYFKENVFSVVGQQQEPTISSTSVFGDLFLT